MTQKPSSKIILNDKEFEDKNNHIFKYLNKELDEYKNFGTILEKCGFKKFTYTNNEINYSKSSEPPCLFKDLKDIDQVLKFIKSNALYTSSFTSPYSYQKEINNKNFIIYKNEDFFVALENKEQKEVFNIEDIIHCSYLNHKSYWYADYSITSNHNCRTFSFRSLEIPNSSASHRREGLDNFIISSLLNNTIGYTPQNSYSKPIIDYSLLDVFNMKPDEKELKYHKVQSSFNSEKNTITLSFKRFIVTSSITDCGYKHNDLKEKHILSKKITFEKFVDFVNNGNKIDYKPKGSANKKEVSMLKKEIDIKNKIIKAQMIKFEQLKNQSFKISDVIASNIKEIRKIQEDILDLEN